MAYALSGPWGPGPVSGLGWWSGVSWRTLGCLEEFVSVARCGRGVDLLQLFAPAQQGQNTTWDMIAGGAGDDPGVHEGVLTFRKGGKQGSVIWSNPLVRALPVAYAIRPIPENLVDSNEGGANPRTWADIAAGKRDDVWRRLGARFAWLDRQFNRTQPLILEIGWEMSGAWYPWSIHGKLGDVAVHTIFPDAWMQIVRGLRAGYRAQAGAHCPYLFCFRPARITVDGVRLHDFLPCPSTWDCLGVTAHDNAPVTSKATPRASWHPHSDKEGRVAMEGWTACAEVARRYRRGVAFLEWAGYPPESTTYKSGDGGLFVESFWQFCQDHADVLAAECYFDRESTSLIGRPSWSAPAAYRARWGGKTS